MKLINIILKMYLMLIYRYNLKDYIFSIESNKNYILQIKIIKCFIWKGQYPFYADYGSNFYVFIS